MSENKQDHISEPTLKEKTAKGLFWGGVSNGFQQVWTLVFGIILARILSPGDYGVVGMLAIFTAIGGSIQESGFTVALINKKEIKHEDYNAVFWFNIISGCIMYVILFLLAPFIADFFHRPELIDLSRFLFLGIVISGMGIAHNAILVKKLMTKEKAKVEMYTLVISGLIGLVMALKGFGYWALAVQTTTYTACGTFLRWYFSPWRPTLHFNFSPLKEMFGFSIKLFITNIFFQISNHFFSVILGRFYDAQLVGYYSQGNKWMNIGSSFIVNMLAGISQPVLAEVRDEKERQKKVFRKMIRFGAFISFPLMLGLGFVADEFILITIGEKWLESAPFLQILCVWGSLTFLWDLYTRILLTHGKSDIYMWGMIIIGLLQLVVVMSMFSLGIYWMVVGYAFVYLFGLLGWQYFANKYIEIKLWELLKDILPYLFVSLTCFVVAWFVTRHIQNVYLLFILKVGISAFLYILVMKVTKSVIFSESIMFLREMINKKKEN